MYKLPKSPAHSQPLIRANMKKKKSRTPCRSPVFAGEAVDVFTMILIRDKNAESLGI